MQKIVINTCFGGFGLSDRALSLFKERGGDGKNVWGIARDDPILVGVVEELGEEAGDVHARLKVVSIPDDATNWYIEEYDGKEHIAEPHETWS